MLRSLKNRKLSILTRAGTLRRWILATLALLLFSQPGNAQDFTQADIAQRIMSIKDELASAELGDEQRTALEASLKSTQSALSSLNGPQSLLDQRLKANEEAPEKVVEIEQEVATLKSNASLLLDEFKVHVRSLDIGELEVFQTDLQQSVRDLKAEIEQLDQIGLSHVQQRETRTTDLQRVQVEFAAANGELQKLPVLPTDIQEQIELVALQSRILELELNRKLLEAQLQSAVIDKRLDFSQKARERFTLLLSMAEAKERHVSLTINVLQELAAQRHANEASENARTASQQFPLLTMSEEKTVELANQLAKIEQETSNVESEKQILNDQFERLNKKFRETASRISTIGNSSSIGAMLRKRRSELPDSQLHAAQSSQARVRIEALQKQWFELDEQINDLDPTVIRAEIESESSVDDARWAELEKPVQQLIERRLGVLEPLRNKTSRLFEEYLDVETTGNQLVQVCGEFTDYINERILWIRSNNLLFTEWQDDQPDRVLASPKHWATFSEPFVASTKRRPIALGSSVLLLVGLLILGSTFRRRVDEHGETAKNNSCCTFWPTAHATLLTLIISISVPIVVVGAGWLMQLATPSGNPIYDAVARALLTAGCFAVPFEVLRRICRRNGLASNHFDWTDESVARLKRQLDWYVLPASTIVFVVNLFINIDATHRVDLIERTVFVVGMLMTCWFSYQVFSPSKGIFARFLRAHKNSWSNQTSSLWFGGILLVPAVLGLLAVAGYYYTALHLTECLFMTFAIAVAIELVRALIRRFVLVRRRYAHIEHARRERRAASDAAAEAHRKAIVERQRRIDAGEEVGEETLPVMNSESLVEIQPEHVDIDENAGQANQLIRMLGFLAWFVGIWIVWSDVLPAVKALDEYHLWQTGAIAQSQVPPDSAALLTGAPDEPSTVSESPASSTHETKSTAIFSLETPVDNSVSLRDFLIFLAIVMVTFFAARNLPNAVEVMFLDQLPVDRSARFAAKALFSYAIIVLGTLLALRTLSINWSNIQWLVTALTFGLAFGLQEIFANFVAGIILMFERPMRIGDLITVDEFTGVVTRIRTRATTIVNWDRKEYVIPNKDFITGRLINWTLSDAINRIQFTVGIAYGSDVARAKKIIFDICKNQPSIVDKPPTSITLQEFGNSTLDLVVRTFLGEVSSRLTTVDDLHTKINAEFEAAGIEIAFPQQDLHVRTLVEQTPQAE